MKTPEEHYDILYQALTAYAARYGTWAETLMKLIESKEKETGKADPLLVSFMKSRIPLAARSRKPAETLAPVPIRDVELISTDDMVEEISRRYPAVVFAHFQEARLVGEHKGACCSYRSGHVGLQNVLAAKLTQHVAEELREDEDSST